MSTFIKSFQLLNFQSWANDSKEVHLEKDVMNIIEGANETGKSVFYKVMYNMVFPGYWSAQELIRRGYSTAAMLLHLADGMTIIYVLERSHYSITFFNDEVKNSWEDYKALPDEIVEELGLILDTKNKVILNIIDKDVPLPFIKTTPSFNASLFLAIIEPPEITEFYETLKEQMKEADAAKNIFYATAASSKRAADILPFYDVDELTVKKQRVDRYTTFTENFEKMRQCLSTLCNDFDKQPVAVKDPSEVLPYVNVFDIVTTSISVIDSLKSAIAARPKQVAVPEWLDEHMDCYDSVFSLCKVIADIETASAARPAPVKFLTLEDEFRLLQSLEDAVTCARNIEQEYQTQTSCVKKRDELSAHLSAMQSEYGVCPTCGRLLEETHI